MKIRYPEMGICGLACQLCPQYHTDAKSRCGGCKSESRMALGCLFITCAIKKKKIEFCWECKESHDCEKWKKHREAGTKYDSFKCYQKLEEDIDFIQEKGFEEYKRLMDIREEILKDMLDNFNEGRSKSYYCIAATVMKIEELKEALRRAKEKSHGLDMKSKAKVLRSLLEEIAKQEGYSVKLRKKGDEK
ncbi:Protein of unknown function [Natronincola peptidivorans]|uniref:DUF3795 domain-containing protein n=1 Tax=Natronincola peptidivorans TaxID=426128 RepID=A0A1I0FM62_9FIRM|nr:DUF3795 domain-containing protein [Natronincola peptidivorans]SET59467.1 Protein of unknown function [Natronincola peptidivorans]